MKQIYSIYAVLLTCPLATAQADKLNDPTLRAKIEAGWHELHRIVNSEHGYNYERVDYEPAGKKTVTKGYISVSKNGFKISTVDWVYNYSPRYAFVAKKGETGGYSLLKRLTPDELSKSNDTDFFNFPIGSSSAVVFHGLDSFAGYHTLESLFELYIVAFDNDHTTKDGNVAVRAKCYDKSSQELRLSCEFVLSPVSNYVPLSSEITSNFPKTKGTKSYETRKVNAGEPLRCLKYVIAHHFMGFILKHEHTFSDFSDRGPKATELTLGYYDLPEPPGLEKQQEPAQSNYQWLFGLGMIPFGFLLIRAYRKRLARK